MNLPSELVAQVLSYLDITSLYHCSQTCRQWRGLISAVKTDTTSCSMITAENYGHLMNIRELPQQLNVVGLLLMSPSMLNNSLYKLSITTMSCLALVDVPYNQVWDMLESILRLAMNLKELEISSFRPHDLEDLLASSFSLPPTTTNIPLVRLNISVQLSFEVDNALSLRLVPFLRYCPELKILKLTTSKSNIPIQQFFDACPKLETIDINSSPAFNPRDFPHHNNQPPRGIRYLSLSGVLNTENTNEFLASQRSTLTCFHIYDIRHLSFSSNHLQLFSCHTTDHDEPSLAQILRGFPNLHHLIVRDLGCRTLIQQEFLDAIRAHRSLQHLKIDLNLGQEGCYNTRQLEIILQALSSSHSLKTLGIHYADRIDQNLLDALFRNTSLKKLNLTGNMAMLSGSSYRVKWMGFAQLQSLQRLSLTNIVGVQLEGLCDLKYLERVYLTKCHSISGLLLLVDQAEVLHRVIISYCSHVKDLDEAVARGRTRRISVVPNESLAPPKIHFRQ